VDIERREPMSTRSAVPIVAALLVFGVCALASAKDTAGQVLDGLQMDAGEAENLEAFLKRRPEDLVARTELLGYYSKGMFRDKAVLKPRARHILWLIQNHPEAEVLGLPAGQIHAPSDQEGYAQVKEAWLEQLKNKPQDLAVLSHSAAFFLLGDRELAQKSLETGRALDMKDPRWPAVLGHLYSLNMIRSTPEDKLANATKALEQYDIAYELTTDPGVRSFYLRNIGKAAIAANRLDRAKQAGERMLRENGDSSHPDDMTHLGHIVLGIVGLRTGDVAKGKEHLLRAGDVSQTPSLRGSGPNMLLAKELLEKGERTVVLKYLKLCNRFWERGEARLKTWSAAIETGKVPDFGANLVY
jgi:tetratricopeptide (TPR) repeat protein